MSLSTWVVACADGLEGLLAQECTDIGASVIRQEPSAVWVEGDLRTAYNLCLWSRLASRVYKPLFKLNSASPDEMYAEALDYPWHELFDLDKTFAVRAVATRGVVCHTQYMALRLKDAIVDCFRQHTGERPNIDPKASDINLHVLIQPESITISLDMSGESLHRRG